MVEAVRALRDAIDRGPVPWTAAAAAALVVLLPLLALGAARPELAILCLLLIAALAVAHRAAAARVVAIAAAITGVLALALLAAFAPWAAVATAAGGLVLAAAWVFREPIARDARARPEAAAAIFIAVLAAPLVLATWPVTTSLVAIVAGTIVLAWWSPPWALGVGVLLFGFEGSIKLLLGLEGTPLGGNRAVGALAIDVALFSAVAGVLFADRLRTPWTMWSRATRGEKRALLALGAWLALSVLQMAEGGDLNRGVHGFRLFQLYTLVAVAAAAVFMQPRLRRRATQGLLAIGFVVALYAAVRVVFGPSRAEHDFATSVRTVVAYGGALRAIGSFSSAVGLVSFLAPMTAFALVIGFMNRGFRRLAWAVAALGLVGLIGSYGRASLFGLALGLLFALVLVVAAADMPARRKLTAAGLVVALMAGTYGGAAIASHASPQLRERLNGIVDPLGDKSAQLRFNNWERTLRAALHEPFGRGVGASGGGSAPTRAQLVTTDNSFLKVLYDQGFLGFALFTGGLLVVLVLLARRFRGPVGGSRALGLAALAGFVTFLGISLSGEYVEQPGKVVAWGLLGIALAQALGDPRGVDPETKVEWRVPAGISRTLTRAPAVTLPRRAPAVILGTAGFALVTLLMYFGRHMSTFRLDEWAFVLDRQGNSLDDFLRPHNEHLSLIPVAVFKGLLATVGMHPYWPYRLVVAMLTVLIGVLVYLYARPRLGRGWALAPAFLTMLVGQGGYDVVWPFQIGFDVSVACGVGMLLCFDRRSPRSDLAAGALLLVALSSSSIGIAVAVAALIEVLASRAHRLARAMRILVVPIVAYGIWWLHYRPSSSTGAASGLDAVRLLVDVSGTATGGLFSAPGGARRLLALALFAAVAVGFARRRDDRRALIVAFAMPAAYWVLLIAGRGSTGDQLLDSRYILPGAIFVGCVLSELLRGSTARARPWMAIPVALGVLLITAHNVSYVRDIADFEVQVRGDPLRAELGALSLAGQGRPVDPRFVPAPTEAPSIYAQRYFEATRRFGDPVPHADAVIAGLGPKPRAAADRTYLGATRIRAVPSATPPAAVRRACRTTSGPSNEYEVPPQGVAIRLPGTRPVAVALRRWGPTPIGVGTAGPGWATIRPPRDGARTPLRVRIGGRVASVCDLA
jgi:hypothetical protein